MYEFWKRIKIDAIKIICAFREPTVLIRTCKSTQTSNVMILTSRISLILNDLRLDDDRV